MAVPQPKTLEISEMIGVESLKPRSDEFSLRRIERELASVLKSSDSEIRNEALALSGAVAYLRFDLDAMRRHFDQAVAASGYSSRTYSNYASVLYSAGLLEEALEKFLLALAKAPDDPALLMFGIRVASGAYDVERVKTYAERLAGLKVPIEDASVLEALQSTVWKRQILESPGVTRAEIVKRCETGRSISLAHRLRITHERATPSMRGLLVEWSIDCEDSEIAELNYEVALALSALDPDPCEALMSFGYCANAVFIASEQARIHA